MSKPMWMVRSASGGRLADECVEHGVVAIGWPMVGDLKVYTDKPQIIDALEQRAPEWSRGKIQSSASQLIRFRDELSEGDYVITYDSSRRIYHVGRITGDYRHDQQLFKEFPNVRNVDWLGSVDRDGLSVSTKNTLGSTLTLFSLSDRATDEILARLEGKEAISEETAAEDEEQGESEEEILLRYREEAFEFVKDRVNKLDWEDMERLVAGLLRAMGYQTKISDPGPDRGVDIMASPDGFGFESPRIMVEVKHRGQTVGSQQIRSFLGGRHKDDKGLYVSTGGFTKDARYEAERANIPLMLMDIEDLVKALMQRYEDLDMETKNLLPLRKIYWPV